MAKGETIDPLAFTRDDENMGPRLETDPQGLIPTYDRKGIKRWRKKGRMAGGVRDRILMAQMKSGIAGLWADGRTYPDIAETISDHYGLEGDQRMTAHVIKYHIGKMLDYWRQKGLALMDERQAIILTRFDQIEALAVEAYFASMEGKSTVTKSKQIERAKSKERQKKMKDAEHERRDEEYKKDKKLFIDTGELADMSESLLIVAEKTNRNKRFEENRAGDPKFLNIIMNINVQRAKILGLYQRAENMNENAEAAKLSDEQRHARIATILSAAKERRAATANLLADPAPLGGFAEGDTPTNGNGHVPEVPDEAPDELDWGFDEDTLDLPNEADIEWE